MVDIFFLSRPVLLIPVYIFIVLGYLDGEPFSVHFLLDLKLLHHLFFYAFIMFPIHLTNNVNDIKADRENRGPGFINCSGISLRWLYTASLIFVCIGLAGAVMSDDRWIVLIYLCTLVLGFLYNFRPFYFTGRPFLDFLSNAIEYGVLCYLLGKRLVLNPDINYTNLFSYFFLMSAGAVASTIPDVKGDQKGGKKTTSVYLGVEKALILGIVFLLAALFFGIVGANFIVVVSAGSSIVVFIYAIWFDRNKKNLVFTYQIGGGVLILLVHISYPFLFIVSLFLIGITLIYFKHRKNVIYPRMGF